MWVRDLKSGCADYLGDCTGQCSLLVGVIQMVDEGGGVDPLSE
jgi:hypothetical protein